MLTKKQEKDYRRAIKAIDKAREALYELAVDDNRERRTDDSRVRLCADLTEYADYLDRRLDAHEAKKG